MRNLTSPIGPRRTYRHVCYLAAFRKQGGHPRAMTERSRSMRTAGLVLGLIAAYRSIGRVVLDFLRLPDERADLPLDGGERTCESDGFFSSLLAHGDTLLSARLVPFSTVRSGPQGRPVNRRIAAGRWQDPRRLFGAPKEQRKSQRLCRGADKKQAPQGSS